MRFSRRSNNSAFSGLSDSYSTWNRSRVVNKQDNNNDRSYYILIGAITTLICLQLYYISIENHWQNIITYFWRGVVIILIATILYAASKYIWASQDQEKLKYSALVPNQQYDLHVKNTTKLQISKLQNDPKFKNFEAKSKVGSEKITQSDEQFFNELDELESQFSFQN